jgi:drug/metabolite transporter (DMT)-like permease
MPLLIALLAILLWSTLAFLGSRLVHLPPFLLLGVALGLSGLISLLRPRAWRIPLRTLAVGVTGIFGYHFLYFRAFALAPAVEANLINYLWPLLIVVLSPLLLHGFPLRPRHLLGALLGLLGAALIVTSGKLSLQTQYLPGYLCAAGAAVTWALYSLLTKRLPPFPTDAVAAFCAVGSLLALAFHWVTRGSFAELAALPALDWLYLALIGLGPMGAAFFLWDAALKRGDPRTIGSLAYLTPLLSTLNLVLLAGQRLTALSLAAMLLIVIGAVIGSRAQTKTR